jgi:hypothetical protein
VYESIQVVAEHGASEAGGGVGGLLTRLNAPLIPGLPAVPGLPAISPLGLLAPRLSFAASFLQAGGFAAPNPGQYLIGLAAPRLAPLAALQAGTIKRSSASSPLARRWASNWCKGFKRTAGGGLVGGSVAKPHPAHPTFGRVALAVRMIFSTSSRSAPTSGSRGGRVSSEP